MKGITFTKTMIQNYNRVDAIPELIDGRFYGREHLVYLYYINLLKSDFSLIEIKSILDELCKESDVLDIHNKIFDIQQSIENYRQEYIKKIENLVDNDTEKKILIMLEANKFKNL